MVGVSLIDATYEVHALPLGRSVIGPSDLGCLAVEVGGSGSVAGVVDAYCVVGDVFSFECDPDAFGVGTPSVSFSE